MDVAIVGIGIHPFGRTPERSGLQQGQHGLTPVHCQDGMQRPALGLGQRAFRRAVRCIPAGRSTRAQRAQDGRQRLGTQLEQAPRNVRGRFLGRLDPAPQDRTDRILVEDRGPSQAAGPPERRDLSSIGRSSDRVPGDLGASYSAGPGSRRAIRLQRILVRIIRKPIGCDGSGTMRPIDAPDRRQGGAARDRSRPLACVPYSVRSLRDSSAPSP